MSDDLIQEHTFKIIREQERQIEQAIKGAIMSGYDGVDINTPPPLEDGFGIESIEPWHRDAEPDGANGYRTERYSWHWFSDDELTTIMQAETVTEAMENFV